MPVALKAEVTLWTLVNGALSCCCTTNRR